MLMTFILPQSLQILQEACQKFGYKFEVIDGFSGYLVEVSNGEKSFLSGAGKLTPFPLNLSVPHRLAFDKAHTKNLLQKKGFQVPKGDYFFLRPDERDLRPKGKELEDAISFANNFGYPLYVKPGAGSHGVLGEVIHDERELRAHLLKISERSYFALIEEVLKGEEYRIFVLDGEIQFSYKRGGGIIIGDGKKTIEALISEFSQNLKNPRNVISPDSPFLQKVLEEKGFTRKDILPKGEKLPVNAKTNIAAGGEILDYSETHTEELKKWVKELAETTQLRIFGIDVFSSKGLKNPEDLTILEVNSTPGLSGIYDFGKKEKVMKIWGKILEKYCNNRI